MGTFIKLPGVSAPDRPRADIPDRILPEDGALYLYEFGHPTGGFPAGVPASGTVVRNIAGDQAAALTGATIIDLAGPFLYQGLTGTKGKIERTERGGVAVIQSQTVAPSFGDGVVVKVPVAILNYIAAHPTHSYYASAWVRLTRSAASGTQAFSAIALSASPGAGALLHSLALSLNYPADGTLLTGQRTPSGNWQGSGTIQPADDARFAAVAVSSYKGTVDSTRYGKALNIGTNGPLNLPFEASPTPAKNVSGVLYRAYLEDLTASGRSTAAVLAADTALYAEEVTTPGGRYYGDTYTSPTTLP